MSSDPSRRFRPLSGILAVLLSIWILAGCHGSPTLSDYGNELAMTIANVARRERADQIAPLRELIDRGLEDGKLREDEAAHFHKIVDDLDAGEWELGRERTRDLIADQIID